MSSSATSLALWSGESAHSKLDVHNIVHTLFGNQTESLISAFRLDHHYIFTESEVPPNSFRPPDLCIQELHQTTCT